MHWNSQVTKWICKLQSVQPQIQLPLSTNWSSHTATPLTALSRQGLLPAVLSVDHLMLKDCVGTAGNIEWTMFSHGLTGHLAWPQIKVAAAANIMMSKNPLARFTKACAAIYMCWTSSVNKWHSELQTNKQRNNRMALCLCIIYYYCVCNQLLWTRPDQQPLYIYYPTLDQVSTDGRKGRTFECLPFAFFAGN